MREPAYGEEALAIQIGVNNPDAFIYAKVAVVVPTLTWAGLAGLSRTDGRALMAEVNRIFRGTGEGIEDELGSGGVGVADVHPADEQTSDVQPDQADVEPDQVIDNEDQGR